MKTDNKKIDKFLTRGVEAVYPDVESFKKLLLSGKRLRAYQGFDPTGPYLHVGHAIGIRALRLLQELGHEVIFLAGDFTAMIGDPDKDVAREMLTNEQIERNMAGWQEQAAQLIDFGGKNPVQFKRNSEWLKKLRLEDVLTLMSKTTLQRTQERDLFARRLKAEDPIRLHEIVYPLMQGYDGVAMNVDIEIGGADQTFNMLIGRLLSKAYLNKEKFIRANKMMNAPDGKTMSKTKGNGINLSDSAEDMYGKAMSYADSEIVIGLELLTEVPMEDITQVQAAIKRGENPMQFKQLLAFETVKLIKGDKTAKEAEQNFVKVFQKKEAPEKARECRMKNAKCKIIDLLITCKLADSKSEARRIVEQGGVKIDGQVVGDLETIVKLSKKGVLVQKGKRHFVRVYGS